MNPALIAVGTVAVLSLATLLMRILKRRKSHPAGPDKAAAHPLNTAGIAPASGTKIPEHPTIKPLPAIQPHIVPKAVETPSDMPAHHPPPPPELKPQPVAAPPAAPEFEMAPPAAPAPVAAEAPEVSAAPPPSTQPTSLLDGLPEMHKPGDVFHPQGTDGL